MLTQFLLPLTSYVTTIYLSKLRVQHWYFYELKSRLYLDFICFSTNVVFLSQWHLVPCLLHLIWSVTVSWCFPVFHDHESWGVMARPPAGWSPNLGLSGACLMIKRGHRGLGGILHRWSALLVAPLGWVTRTGHHRWCSPLSLLSGVLPGFSM